MKVSLDKNFEFEVFQLEQIKDVEEYARTINGVVYSWKTTGSSNWLEKGLSVVDVLGLTALPKETPDLVELPNDEDEKNE